MILKLTVFLVSSPPTWYSDQLAKTSSGAYSTLQEEEAEKLMAEALPKNFIDYEEYPQTADIQNKCVNMIARLYNAPTDANEDNAMVRRHIIAENNCNREYRVPQQSAVAKLSCWPPWP